jgi:hypothetical protein
MNNLNKKNERTINLKYNLHDETLTNSLKEASCNRERRNKKKGPKSKPK